MGKTGYQTSWNALEWIQPVKGNESAAHYTLCQSDFAVSNRGHSQVVSRTTSLKHKNWKRNQSRIPLYPQRKNKDGQALLFYFSATLQIELLLIFCKSIYSRIALEMDYFRPLSCNFEKKTSSCCYSE